MTPHTPATGMGTASTAVGVSCGSRRVSPIAAPVHGAATAEGASPRTRSQQEAPRPDAAGRPAPAAPAEVRT